MTTFASYSTGTVSVAANGTTVTGTGTIWSPVNARPGDLLQIGSVLSFVADVVDTTHLTIPAYAGSTVSGVAYTLWKVSPLRFAGGQAMADVSALVAVLNGMGTIYAVTGAAPDPSIGADGQYALKTNASIWQLWLKTSGAWVLQGQPIGTTYIGDYDNTHTYAVSDLVTSGGTLYISKVAGNVGHPPASSPTQWGAAAAAGAAGANGATWTSGTGVPAGGNSGDFYLRTSDGSLWKNTAGTWNTITNLTGATGPAGLTPNISSVSTSAVTVGTGSKLFTVDAGLSWLVGMRLRVVNVAGDRVMSGTIASYIGNGLSLTVDFTQGVGTDNSWRLFISGEIGLQGGTGTQGATGAKGDTGATGAASTVPGPQGVKGDTGAGLAANASGTLAQRTPFDSQAQGFLYLQTDVAPFRLYIKASNTTGDWTGPTYIGGNFPVGDLGHITDSIVQTFDFGHIV